MSKLTVPAAGGAMPASGPIRLALVPLTGSAMSALATMANGPDAKIIAVAAEIAALDRRYEMLMRLVRPHDEAREALRCKLDMFPPSPTPEYWAERAKVDAFDAEHGLDILHERAEALTAEICDLQTKMFALSAETERGRRIKVATALRLAHCRHDPWLGPTDELGFGEAIIRGLLGEFAGMSEEELANV